MVLFGGPPRQPKKVALEIVLELQQLLADLSSVCLLVGGSLYSVSYETTELFGYFGLLLQCATVVFSFCVIHLCWAQYRNFV